MKPFLSEQQHWTEVWDTLVAGIRQQVQGAGFTDVVLGLSGGIDSALVAALAVDALGAERVHGVLMPSPWSSKGSVDDSLQLAANLGMSTHTVPIEPMMQAFEASLAPVFAAREPDVTEENLQSRIRGVLLMALSNKFGWMLLATGNKSEILTGYCTLYGDTCGALAPIGDVYKTAVYGLCAWYNERAGTDRIPQAILDKAPSAELRPNQVDQDSLPPYPVLDRLLAALLVANGDANVLLAAGEEPALVERVAGLYRGSAFKRRFLPPVITLAGQL